MRSTLQRAAGFIPYNTNAVSGIPQKFYSFNQVSSGNLYPIVDTTAGVYYVPPGGVVPTTIQTKTQGKQSSFFGIGNYLFIGNAEFSRKWDTGSPQGTTNWGIAIGSINASVNAYVGAGANVGASNPWINPTNIQGSPDGLVASVTVTAGSTSAVSALLNGTNYGFALNAASSIQGIQMVLTCTFTGGAKFPYTSASLLYNGNVIGTGKLGTFNGTVTLGSASDLWGAVLTPNIVNSSSFGVQFYCFTGAHSSLTVTIDAAQITVFFTGGPTVSLVAGTLTATQGYQYLFCYGNSNDNNISNPTPASVSIKPVAQGVQISLTASTDPQVNQIRVFRTTDTGTGAVFFELPTSPYPNTTANVTDNALDTSLQVAQAITVGSLSFSPPPAGLVNIEWYAGRLWGSVGNLLYFSAGPDNTPMGRGTSNWPPGNVFELPTQIAKLAALNGGNGMIVVTLDGLHIVQGISNPGFTVNKWLSDVGARQQNAVDTDGSNLYIFTSDRQFLQISAQGINELSQNISDQTDAFDPTQVYVCQHRSGSQDSRVFLTDGSTKWVPYNLMMGAWEPPKTPADGSGVGAVSSIEITPGVWKLLKGSTAAGRIIQQRDLSTFNDNGINYPWNVVFGNIPLTDPTQLANVESLVLRYNNQGGFGNIPAVSVLPNDIAGTFIPLGTPVDEPPEGNQPTTSVLAKKYYLGTGPVWSQMTSMQFQISFIAESVQNELLSWGIFPNESADEQVGQIPQVQGR